MADCDHHWIRLMFGEHMCIYCDAITYPDTDESDDVPA